MRGRERGEEEREVERERERITKVQACFGNKMFIPNFRHFALSRPARSARLLRH